MLKPVAFSNVQPSLAITEVVNNTGVFPQVGSGPASWDTIGFIYDFAGTYAPAGSFLAAGQQMSVASDMDLFTELGSVYGGNNTTVFNLPNLDGNATIGVAAGLAEGVLTGSATITLSPVQVPTKTTPAQPFDNLQKSLPVMTLICVSGAFPSTNSGDAEPFLGQIAQFAGTSVPQGWAVANGQLLSINANQALFSVIGIAYGGDGTSDFALPNLSGTVAVGADATHPIGTAFGEASTTVTTADLPPGGLAVNNDQPSVAVEYLVCTSGLYPTRDELSGGFSTSEPTLGQIVEFAGGIVPYGFASATGQLLPIASNQALYSIIGTVYGGNGSTNFALPDFRGRTAIGAEGTTVLGAISGADTTVLTAANIPACYVAGTLIETAHGEVAIERLAIGDQVRTAAGPLRPIRWIGYRSYGGRFLRANPHLAPIRFAAGCLGDGLPRRDLLMSASHAILLSGCLFPAAALQNGDRIRPDRSFTTVDYIHIELDTHDAILAEGAAAETFLDDDSRHIFHNAATFAARYPDVKPGAFCAPRFDSGFELEAVRRHLAATALRQAAAA